MTMPRVAANPVKPAALAEQRRASWRQAGWRLARDRRVPVSLAILALILLTALLAPVVAPYDAEKLGVGLPLAGPSAQHPMGLDNYGRDQLSRVIFGARISLLVAVTVVLGALLLGLPVGLIAGYFGGGIDNLLMRLVDVVIAFPWILVAMGIATVVGPGLTTVLLALALVYSPMVARLARGVVLGEREREYVMAARVIGVSTPSIIVRHILPNASSPLLVQAISVMSFSILAEAALSYLGLGTQPPTPSWGLMLADSGFYMGVAQHMALFPGAAIVVLVLGLNLFGDALRDELDPRYRTGA